MYAIIMANLLTDKRYETMHMKTGEVRVVGYYVMYMYAYILLRYPQDRLSCQGNEQSVYVEWHA